MKNKAKTTASIVYQVVEAATLWDDTECRLFLWDSLEQAFGTMPFVLSDRGGDINVLRGLAASFNAFATINKLLFDTNPFDVLIREIQHYGRLRVWVDLASTGEAD